MINEQSIYKNDLVNILETVSSKGWVKSRRKSHTGIGKTLEDLLEKKEDNLPIADYKDIEIKSRNRASKSMVSLFTKVPTYPKRANSFLADNYGYYEKDNFGNTYDTKSFFVSVSGKRAVVSQVLNMQVKLKVDRVNERVYLILKDIEDKRVINDIIYWSFSDISKALKRKLKHICIVHADKRVGKGGQVEYKYDDYSFIKGFNIDKFIDGIENGIVFIDIRIGVSKSRRKRHDHGTGFRISYNDLEKYNNGLL